MKKINYLRCALTTPAVLALAAWSLERLGFPTMLGDMLMFSMAIGDVPYGLTLLVLMVISFRGKIETFEKWWFFSPFLMMSMSGVCGLGAMFFVGFSTGWEPVQVLVFFGIWVITGMYTLLVGYVYVLLAAWILVILQKFNFITGITISEHPCAVAPIAKN